MLTKFIYLILLCCSVKMASGQLHEPEADVKAAFIYNFINYIEWDQPNNDNDFTIGVIGSSPVTESLMNIAKTSTAKNKKIVVRVFNKPEDIGDCQILFIPQNSPFSLHSILEKTDKGMLTISEENGYAKQGTAFNFVIIKDKLKFEANLKTIYTEGLKASSQLLKLAIIVD
jgi:hypothetical protein